MITNEGREGKMEVVLIATPTRNSGNIKSLRESIARRGWTLKEIEAKDLALEVSTSGLRVLYEGKEFNPKAVIYRMVGRFLPLLAPILDYWISLGICVINSPIASMAAWSKMQSTIAFAKAGVPFLDTVFTYPHILGDEIEKENPYVIKPIFGTKGHDIRFLNSKEETNNFLSSTYFYSDGLIVPPLMVQEDLGIDVREIRAQVIGGKCVALMRRIPPQDQRFSQNLEGGVNENLPLTHPAVELAEKTAKALDLDFAGIDLFETKDGTCLVSEANGSPGWVGLEVVSGVSVSDALFDLIEARVILT